MATAKERQIENKNLQAKLKTLAPNSPEYNRIMTRINYNNSLIGKTGNVNSATNKAVQSNISKTNTENVNKQDLAESSSNITKAGIGVAGDLLNQGNFSTAFNPTLTARTGTGNLVADRQRIEDEVFNRLTRGMDTAKNSEREQLSQTLYNRGIPLGSELYDKQMEEFDRKYDLAKQDARGQAVQMGGDEYARSFGIGEQTRANELSEQSNIHNQRIGDVGTFAGIGLAPYTAVQTVKQNQQQLNQAKRPIGGSGARTPQAPAPAPSPFNNTTPPSYNG